MTGLGGTAMKREEELTVAYDHDITLQSVKAADGNTDDADPRTVLLAVLGCAETWVGEARIIGNVRAIDISRAIRSLLSTPKPGAEPVAYLTTRGDAQRLVLAKFVSDEERDVGSNGWDAIPLYAHPPKPEPVGWETDAEWELEMRCANITENTPFAEVSKLINDLWQQYCLAAEPKPEATEGVDRQVHHSKPVVSQNTQIVEDNATEGGAHGKGIAPPVSAPLQRETAETWKQVVGLFRKHGLSEPPFRLRDELVIAFEWAWFGYGAALTAKQTDGRDE